MNRASNQSTAQSKPALLVSEGVFGRHNETVAVRAWSTTTHTVQIAIADATGQHVSTAYLTESDAVKLEDALRSCRYKRRALEAGDPVTSMDGERL